MKRIKSLLSKVVFFSSVIFLSSCSENPLSENDYDYSYDNYAKMMVETLSGKYAYLKRSFSVTTGEIDYMEIYSFNKSEDPFYHLSFTLDRVIMESSLERWNASEPLSQNRNVYSVKGNILFQSGSHVLMVRKGGSYYNMATDQQVDFIQEPVGINKIVIIDDGVFIGDDQYGGLRYQIVEHDDIEHEDIIF